MALTDVNFQAGEGQDFILELPTQAFAGVLTDTLVEACGSQFPIAEIPEVQAGGGNIFISVD